MDNNILFLDPIQILYDSNQSLIKGAVFIINGEIKAFGEKARALAKEKGLNPQDASEKIIAPCLVDPHSFLIDPINGESENLTSLSKKASEAGYGQLALLPNGNLWRDSPDSISGLRNQRSDLLIHFFGSFSMQGEGKELSPHADLLENGAIGIAEANSTPPASLIRKGLLINEIGQNPLFFAPRDQEIQDNGIVREGVETLRAGWAPDPFESETLPLSQLLVLQEQYPNSLIRLMNISTAAGVSILENSLVNPMTSVCWWNLISDNSNLSLSDMGWRVIPSLGTPKDRKALIEGLQKETITGVSVNAIALDDSEVKRPINQRLPGISGYHLVLPLLWQELVIKSGWKVEKLWDIMSFGPSRMLGTPLESLKENSNRWLIFDPNKKWIQNINRKTPKTAFNQPFEGKEISGKVIECGIKVPETLSY